MTFSISGTSGLTFPDASAQTTASSYVGNRAQVFTEGKY